MSQANSNYDATCIIVNPRVQELQMKLILAAKNLCDRKKTRNHTLIEIADEAGLENADCPFLARTLHELITSNIFDPITVNYQSFIAIRNKGLEIAEMIRHVQKTATTKILPVASESPAAEVKMSTAVFVDKGDDFNKQIARTPISGAKFRALRESLNMSVAQLAGAMKKTTTVIYTWEKSESSTPQKNFWIELSRLTQVSIQKLQWQLNPLSKDEKPLVETSGLDRGRLYAEVSGSQGDDHAEPVTPHVCAPRNAETSEGTGGPRSKARKRGAA